MLTIEDAIKLHEEGYAVIFGYENGEPIVAIIKDE